MAGERGYLIPRVAAPTTERRIDMLHQELTKAFQRVDAEARHWGRWNTVVLPITTTSYAARVRDWLVVLPASGGTTVLLPDATAPDVALGVVVLKHAASSGAVTVRCVVPTQTIDGAASQAPSARDAWAFWSDGYTWHAYRWAMASGGAGVSDGDKGDITVSGSGATWTIDAGTVTLAKMADIGTQRFIGRVTAGTGVPESLTGTQATTLLDWFTDVLQGVVPASGGGTTNFLRADGTWAAPAGGSGLTHPQVMARSFFGW
jgi:hypothetical protein